jgi:beta-lactamase class A
VVEKFATQGLKEEDFALTLMDVKDRASPQVGHVRGEVPFYPASVVKLFYLVATHRWLEDRKLKDSERIQEALRDMIVDSDNNPTHYLMDLLSGTTSGPELPPAQMKQWVHKRNVVNRYFRSLGYNGINVCQKTWCEGPFGRERDFYGKDYENRNRLTTSATARLLWDIVQGRAVTASRSTQMMKLLSRELPGDGKPLPPKETDDNQATGFSGRSFPQGTRLWSKAGWTETVRHDAAYVELPDGRAFILVTFTRGEKANRDIVPFVSARVVASLPAPIPG